MHLDRKGGRRAGRLQLGDERRVQLAPRRRQLHPSVLQRDRLGPGQGGQIAAPAGVRRRQARQLDPAVHEPAAQLQPVDFEMREPAAEQIGGSVADLHARGALLPDLQAA